MYNIHMVYVDALHKHFSGVISALHVNIMSSSFIFLILLFALSSCTEYGIYYSQCTHAIRGQAMHGKCMTRWWLWCAAAVPTTNTQTHWESEQQQQLQHSSQNNDIVECDILAIFHSYLKVTIKYLWLAHATILNSQENLYFPVLIGKIQTILRYLCSDATGECCWCCLNWLNWNWCSGGLVLNGSSTIRANALLLSVLCSLSCTARIHQRMLLLVFFSVMCVSTLLNATMESTAHNDNNNNSCSKGYAYKICTI